MTENKLNQIIQTLKSLPDAKQLADKVIADSIAINKMPNPPLFDRTLNQWLLTGIPDLTSEDLQDLALMPTQTAVKYIVDTVIKHLYPDITTEFKLIGKGATGCVYQPAVCVDALDNKKYANPDYVMKLTTNLNGQRELDCALILQVLDARQKYFIYPIAKCIPNIAYTPKDCKGSVGLILPLGGKSLDQTNIKSIEQLWQMYLKLLRCANLLEIAGIVHNDINEDNILLTNDTVRIIDFGEAIIPSRSKLINDMERYAKPAEIVNKFNPLFYTIYFHDRVPIDNYYKAYEYLLKFYNKDYVRGGSNDLITNWYKLSKQQIIDDLITPNLYKIDNYRIAMVVSYQLQKIDGKSDSINKLIHASINPHIDETLLPGELLTAVANDLKDDKVVKFVNSS